MKLETALRLANTGLDSATWVDYSLLVMGEALKTLANEVERLKTSKPTKPALNVEETKTAIKMLTAGWCVAVVINPTVPPGTAYEAETFAIKWTSPGPIQNRCVAWSHSLDCPPARAIICAEANGDLKR